jgi:ribosomal protein S18 acetylase RimI-like enzyme
VITVSVVSEVTEDLVGAVHRLLPQLSTSAALPSGADIDRIVSSPVTTLFVARHGRVEEGGGAGARGGDDIVGMLTLAVFLIPTGVRAWVEDVVTDGRAQRQGVGEALVRGAVEFARARGAQTLDLTSRPSREAANRLYLRVGFELRPTNVYRLPLGGRAH